MAQASQRPAAGRVGRVVSGERENTLGLGQRELDILLDRLEAMDRSGQTNSKRGFVRWPFRHASVPLRVLHPGGTEVSMKLACRNISKGGVALLHSAFIHPGSHCIVTLVRRDGSPEELKGVICRCIHRAGKLHELGIQFTTHIDLADYVDPKNGELNVIENVQPQKLSGRLLCVDGNAALVRELQHALRSTRITLATARTAAEALSLVSGGDDSTAFHAVTIAPQLPDTTALELIQQLSAASCVAPIVLMFNPGDAVDPTNLPAHVSLLPLPLSEKPLLHRLASVMPFNLPAIAEPNLRRSA